MRKSYFLVDPCVIELICSLKVCHFYSEYLRVPYFFKLCKLCLYAVPAARSFSASLLDAFIFFFLSIILQLPVSACVSCMFLSFVLVLCALLCSTISNTKLERYPGIRSRACTLDSAVKKEKKT